MNKIVLAFFLLMISYVGYAQKTVPGSFKIANNNRPENEAFYKTSIEKADMEQFRLKDKEVTLEFENGFQCVLMSAKEVFIKGGSIRPDDYQDNFPMTYSLPLFDIAQNGLIMAKSKKLDKRNLFTN